MIKIIKTISDAVYEWVREFNAIDTNMIADLMRNEPEEWHEVTVFHKGEESNCLGTLPIWGTMWSFGDNLDDWWLEEGDGIRIMSECDFRIYKHEEYGYFFGIDGAGYDFYEAHWIPLYNARGIQWHEEEKEN